MEKKKIQNYRGIRPAEIVVVLEGNGTTEYPYEEVKYVVEFEHVAGIRRMRTLGKVVNLTEEERNWFNQS